MNPASLGTACLARLTINGRHEEKKYAISIISRIPFNTISPGRLSIHLKSSRSSAHIIAPPRSLRTTNSDLNLIMSWSSNDTHWLPL